MRTPTPLAPALGGSLGMPHRGLLTDGVALPKEGEGFRFLRDNDRRYAIPRFAAALTRAAKAVSDARPGGTVLFGDLSAERGGQLLPHFSHRSGRDADVLLFATTVDGAPTTASGFVHFGRDGLAWDPKQQRYLRLDVERQWLFVRTLLEDESARVQWVFVSRVVRSLLLEWAQARGESEEMLFRAAEVMAQPHPGGAHDDHIHVRTACTAEDFARGCEPSGTVRAWWPPLVYPDADVPHEELVADIVRPLDAAEPAPAAEDVATRDDADDRALAVRSAP
jgi:penicillin-insensitive murein endopeptidase